MELSINKIRNMNDISTHREISTTCFILTFASKSSVLSTKSSNRSPLVARLSVITSVTQSIIDSAGIE